MRRQLSLESSVEAYAVDRSAADQLGAAIEEVLRTLSETRRQVLVDVLVNNLCVGDIAASRGVSRERVRAEFSAAVSALRHPSRSQLLGAHSGYASPANTGFAGIDHQVFRHILAGSVLGLDGVTAVAVECDLHGWQQVISTAARCQGCPCELSRDHDFSSFGRELSGSGRPRRYCSDACRQRAYRRRKKRS